ncbi:MAG: putative toxin-antitoxin system toxin component, PIN family [Chloroflexota bacterium]|nr:putative toxin-antitoxin system toxin component, PIN family [Chloroflexota bacterium]
MRAVVDTNVLISALLSRTGSPARTVLAWQQGVFELIVSPLLLAELKRALAYPKLRRRIPAAEADRVIEWLGRTATVVPDPASRPPVHSVDPADDYLIALAATKRAVLVTGDIHLLSLRDQLPIHSPASFLALLDVD